MSGFAPATERATRSIAAHARRQDRLMLDENRAGSVVLGGPIDHKSDRITINHGDRTIARWGRRCTGLGRISFRYVVTLLSRPETFLSFDDLTTAIWGDDPNGGPISPRDCLCVQDRRLRDPLLRLGIVIVARHNLRKAAILPYAVPEIA